MQMDTYVVCKVALEKEDSENDELTDILEMISKSRIVLDDEDTESKSFSVETVEPPESP